MSCDPELVSAFLDGELDPIIVNPVVAHLLQCDNCCQTMGWLAQVKHGVAGHAVWQDPEEMTQSIMGLIRNEKVYTGRRRLFDRLRRFGVPTVLLVTALAGSPLVDGSEENPEHSGQEALSPAGHRQGG
ncbi:MAG: zf-HC2 domain-containing protein [Magnetococcus sp. DMHC-8]